MKSIANTTTGYYTVDSPIIGMAKLVVTLPTNSNAMLFNNTTVLSTF